MTGRRRSGASGVVERVALLIACAAACVACGGGSSSSESAEPTTTGQFTNIGITWSEDPFYRAQAFHSIFPRTERLYEVLSEECRRVAPDIGAFERLMTRRYPQLAAVAPVDIATVRIVEQTDTSMIVEWGTKPRAGVGDRKERSRWSFEDGAWVFDDC